MPEFAFAPSENYEDDDDHIKLGEGTVLDLGSAVVNANKAAAKFVKNRNFQAAKIALCRALTVDQENSELWTNLSSVLWGLRAYEDAFTAATTACQLSGARIMGPVRLRAFLALANSLVSLGKREDALQAFGYIIRSAEELGEDSEGMASILRDAYWNRTLLLLSLGRYDEGWEKYHLRIDKDKVDEELDLKRYGDYAPLWNGEPLRDQTILVHHDQGYGDTILHSRFLHNLVGEAKQVYFATAPDLVPLFWDFTEEGPGVQFVHQRVPLPRVDKRVYLGSIPSILYRDRTWVTPPKPSPLILSRATKDLGTPRAIELGEPGVHPHLKVGVVWSGRPDFVRNDERQVPLKMLASLTENPHIWLYSLQAGLKAKELYDLGIESFVRDHSDEIDQKGWVGTATAMLQCDLVLTCCTSTAHLAGSLFVPTWVMLGTDPYWPWGALGGTTPWYPTVRLFRQSPDRRGDWSHVIETVRAELNKFLSEKASRNA